MKLPKHLDPASKYSRVLQAIRILQERFEAGIGADPDTYSDRQIAVEVLRECKVKVSDKYIRFVRARDTLPFSERTRRRYVIVGGYVTDNLTLQVKTSTGRGETLELHAGDDAQLWADIAAAVDRYNKRKRVLDKLPPEVRELAMQPID